MVIFHLDFLEGQPVDDGDQRHVVVWTDPGALGMLHGVAEHGDVNLVFLKPDKNLHSQSGIVIIDRHSIFFKRGEMESAVQISAFQDNARSEVS